jgi:hypothetical protein
MKSPDQITDDEFAPLVRQAADLPDAPAEMLMAASQLFSAPTLRSTARAATRLLAAALRFDSWAAAPLAFGMRSQPDDIRHLLFSAMGRDIDLRIASSKAQFVVTGQILGPDESGRAELTAQRGSSAHKRVAPIDELGEFHLDNIERGTYMLTLHMGGDEIVLPPIEVGAQRA